MSCRTPPFSKLDIITCRNLLIYLEPDVQHRLLSVLHFGLREGGVLFLGTNEAVAGSEDLFEPIDKKFRIYRRIGPTRHGTIQFPSLRRLAAAGEERRRNEAHAHVPAAVAQLTDKILLEQHTPAAVTVDRDFQVVHFHGNTSLFLNQPRGQATRDLLALAHDSMRNAIRAALHHAAAQNGRAAVLDGYIERQPGHRARVLVTASPLDPKSAPDLYVISFEERGDASAPPTAEPDQMPAGAPAGTDELRRAREELQSTIEELQTSNEELKASNEEVMSVNEELQSTNEELETSKEEMQSLNEELTTVNSQLQGKVEQYQAISNDLSSLLASTDIAVIFLDTRFRIRRFTPAMNELFGLIGSDIGRPLSDLAKKFTDTELVADVAAVLAKLVPIEKEVAAQDGQWFLRRVLPYRTADNRISGVVVTFVNITERKHAERTRTLLAAIVESSADAIIGFGLDGRIVSWNLAAERMFGYSRAEALSMDLAALCPEERREEERQMIENLRGGRYVPRPKPCAWPRGRFRWTYRLRPA